ncbi:MAG: hypothetical protein CR984_02885 [Proteobacteria bacterium]|nr:MAG: hypothetical protein CR984_02885 [Pseudomonadota bacterium]PIE67950.1 MAG: hypothetical protein CSA23_01340 [Deltaproteobacteria bacterium]
MITKTGRSGNPIRFGMVLAVFLLTMLTGEGIAGNLLTSVVVQPSTVDTAKNGTARVSWKLMNPGVMDAFICDLNGRIVRTFLKRANSTQGAHEAVWDGRDDAGRLCPTGAYIPIVKVRTRQKGIDIYNPTVSPWGLKLAVDENDYDNENGLIRYRLSRPAVCQIRVGEKDGGPCYRSIFAWEPRDRGDHTVTWDGKDASGLKDVWTSERFRILVDAFTLPDNAILLSGCDRRAYDYSTLKKCFPITPPRGKTVSLHALHQRERCHDMTISARFLTDQPSTTDVSDLSGQRPARPGKD